LRITILDVGCQVARYVREVHVEVGVLDECGREQEEDEELEDDVHERRDLDHGLGFLRDRMLVMEIHA
jgi:hypothetical protein